MKTEYDIFISYRHDSTDAKAQHLHTLLEMSGFEGRVSFDKDNLRSRFDIEILKRIDSCTDFVVVLGEDSLAEVKIADTEHYKKLAACSIEDFPSLEAKLNHTDFVRLEIARALHMGKNIVPIVPVKSPTYRFSDLDLPDDIALLTKWQAVFYRDKDDSFMFKDIMPKLMPKLLSKPNGNLGSGISASQEVKSVQSLDWKNIWKITGCVLLSLALSAVAYRVYDNKLSELKELTCIDDFPMNWAPDISMKQIRAIHEICGNMEFLKGGEFMMGVAEENLDQDVDLVLEMPQVRCAVSSFYIGKYEVTVGQWGSVMGEKFRKADAMFPKTDVTWNDCQAFIQKLMNLTGLEFSLPTEAEWEYAAKGGDIPDFTKYSGTDDPIETGWHRENRKVYICNASSSNRCANGADLFDMSSNVSEWCDDLLKPYNGLDVLDYDARVIRGGNFMSEPYELTVTHRDSMKKDASAPTIGFRLVIRKQVW